MRDPPGPARPRHRPPAGRPTVAPGGPRDSPGGPGTGGVAGRSPRLPAHTAGQLADREGPSQADRTLATASSTKLRPFGDRVVIKPTPREEMTKSGILLPDTAKEKPQEGEVLAVGPGKTLDDGKRESMDVSVGQKVLYAKYAGTEFKVEEDELLIVSQKDILAVVE